MFNKKINQFNKFDSKLNRLRTDKLEYENKIKSIDNQIKNTADKKLDYGIQYFLDKEKRLDLLTQAEKFGYSQTKINKLRPYIDEWNQDIITNDIVDSFRAIEQYVKDNQESYKNSLVYRFSKFFDDEGGNKNAN